MFVKVQFFCEYNRYLSLFPKNITQEGKNKITNNVKNTGNVTNIKKYSNYLSFNEIYNLIDENVHTFQSVCF